jgi:hypothetical protein
VIGNVCMHIFQVGAARYPCARHWYARHPRAEARHKRHCSARATQSSAPRRRGPEADLCDCRFTQPLACALRRHNCATAPFRHNVSAHSASHNTTQHTLHQSAPRFPPARFIQRVPARAITRPRARGHGQASNKSRRTA